MGYLFWKTVKRSLWGNGTMENHGIDPDSETQEGHQHAEKQIIPVPGSSFYPCLSRVPFGVKPYCGSSHQQDGGNETAVPEKPGAPFFKFFL